TYRLHLVARSGTLTRRTVVLLTVGGSSEGGGATSVALPRFTITGNAGAPLEPGVHWPIDLRIANPNPAPLVVTSLSARTAMLSAPHATALLPCTPADFAVQPYA